MKLIYPELSCQFKFTENEHPVIVIENPTNFTRFCQELFEQCNGKDGKFVLSEDDSILVLDKAMYMIIE